jgi:hypothetical protein
MAGLIATLLSVFGCRSSKSGKTSDANPTKQTLQHLVATLTPCPDAADGLALDKLWPLFTDTPNDLTVWMSDDYSKNRWEPVFQAWQEKLDKYRAWAGALQDRCARDAYLHWLDYYQRQLETARDELRTHAEQNHMQQYDAQLKRERADRDAYQQEVNGKFPDPPH